MPMPTALTPRRLFLIGFVGLIAAGTLLLQFTGRAGGARPATWLDHLFTATSAISTTGLATVTITEAYSTWGQVLVLLLFQIGGLGYLMLASVIALPRGEVSELQEGLITTASYIPDSFELRRFLRMAVEFTFLTELVGTGVLAVGFRQNGYAWGEALWQGLFHSVSAFCTAGFGLHAESLVSFRDTPLISATILVLAILGAIGFLAVPGVYARVRGQIEHVDYLTKAVALTFVIAFVAFAVLFATTSETIAASAYPWLDAAFLSGTALTGAGFSTVDTAALSLGTLSALWLPMCIGSAPTGTSGGIKLSNVAIAAAVLWAQRSEDDDPGLFGTDLEPSGIRTAMSVIVLYTLLMALGLTGAFYLAPSGFAVADLAFEVVSAIGTVGLSRGITAELTQGLKLLLVGLMFVGRVGVFTLVLGVVARVEPE